jgi:hypothetical protein
MRAARNRSEAAHLETAPCHLAAQNLIALRRSLICNQANNGATDLGMTNQGRQGQAPRSLQPVLLIW